MGAVKSGGLTRASSTEHRSWGGQFSTYLGHRRPSRHRSARGTTRPQARTTTVGVGTTTVRNLAVAPTCPDQLHAVDGDGLARPDPPRSRSTTAARSSTKTQLARRGERVHRRRRIAALVGCRWRWLRSHGHVHDPGQSLRPSREGVVPASGPVVGSARCGVVPASGPVVGSARCGGRGGGSRADMAVAATQTFTSSGTFTLPSARQARKYTVRPG
jgi:hypothetical protein